MIDLKALIPNIVDPSLRGKIFWFYGAPGTRKTSIAAKFPKSLIVATEKGYKFINGAIHVDIQNWNEVRQIARQLKDEEVQSMYQTIVFDRADTLYEYCKQYICKTQGIQNINELAYSQGYTLARKEFDSVIKGIENLGYGMVFITHDKVDMEKATKQDLENNAAKVLRGYADFTFLVQKEKTEDGMDTVMAYADLVGAETKSRLRYFTPNFEFTYDNLQDELKKAIEKQIEMEGIEVKVQSQKAEEKRNFEEIRESVMEKVYKYQTENHPELNKIAWVIKTQMNEVPISQATEAYYDQLLTIETFLLGLEE